MPPAMQNLRCGECAKLLARALGYAELQIKCPRCGTLNHMKAESLPQFAPSDLKKAPAMQNLLLKGDALSLLPTLEAGSFDALITDPPYASGGLNAAARQKPPSEKYPQGGRPALHADFLGDERDQRSHLRWMVMWLSECARLLMEGAPVCVLTAGGSCRSPPMRCSAPGLPGAA